MKKLTEDLRDRNEGRQQIWPRLKKKEKRNRWYKSEMGVHTILQVLGLLVRMTGYVVKQLLEPFQKGFDNQHIQHNNNTYIDQYQSMHAQRCRK